MQDFWNDRYKQHGMIYGTAPNEFFREQLSHLKPGTILLPAEGEGRNAVHAARQGWKVKAFDFSHEGRAKALSLAAEQGVSIQYQLAHADTFAEEPEQFDAVALVYVHLMPDLREQLHQKIVQWLKPGGVLILEAFHPKQLNYTSGGPKHPEMLYTSAMLRQDFHSLSIKILEALEVQLAEGPGHSGAAYVCRLMALKPKRLHQK